jgi:hypothetical protein
MLNMNLILIENGIKTKVAFYDGIFLEQYQDLAKRWKEMMTAKTQIHFLYVVN